MTGMPSGRCVPSALGINTLRTGRGLYRFPTSFWGYHSEKHQSPHRSRFPRTFDDQHPERLDWPSPEHMPPEAHLRDKPCHTALRIYASDSPWLPDIAFAGVLVPFLTACFELSQSRSTSSLENMTEAEALSSGEVLLSSPSSVSMASSDSLSPHRSYFRRIPYVFTYAVGCPATGKGLHCSAQLYLRIPSSIPRVPALASNGSFIHQDSRPSSPF